LNFTQIDLFDWLKTQPHGYRDLASSGVHGPATMGELGIRLDDLPVSDVNQYGFPPLRELLAAKFGVSVEQVAITPGTSMANYVLMTLMLQSGGAVAMERPVYRPFPAIAESISGRPPLFIEREPAQRYELKAGAVRQLPVDPALVIVTNLHNPSGVLAPFENIDQLADDVAARGGMLMVDEVFLPFVETMQWRTSAARHDHVVATGSLTKAFGLSGLRVGWVLGPKKVIHDVQRLMDYMHVVQATSPEVAAYRVLEAGIGDELLRKARRRAAENLPIVLSALSDLADAEWIEPDGGVVILVRRPSRKPTLSFCQKLYEEENVLTQPGHYFGAPDAVRIGFAGEPVEVADHMKRFVRVWRMEIG